MSEFIVLDQTSFLFLGLEYPCFTHTERTDNREPSQLWFIISVPSHRIPLISVVIDQHRVVVCTGFVGYKVSQPRENFIPRLRHIHDTGILISGITNPPGQSGHLYPARIGGFLIFLRQGIAQEVVRLFLV